MNTCRRREFLLLLLGQATIAVGATLGCGGSGNSGNTGSSGDPATGTSTPTPGATPTPVAAPSATPIPTTPPLSGISAQVVETEIGGTTLTIPSLYEGAIAVGVGGVAALTQSTVAAQMHAVTDPLGQTRALAITLPASRSITFNAASTAAALVFLTPGVLTVDPAEATSRLASIATLPGFSSLVTYLAQNLPINSLEALTAQPTLANLLTGCVTEIVSLLPTRAATPARAATAKTARHITAHSRDTSTNSLTDEIFGASWLPGVDSNGEPSLQAQNSSWRWVSVVAQKLGSDGTTATGNPVALQFQETGLSATAAALNGAFPAHTWSEFSGVVAPAYDTGNGTAAAGLANDHSTAILRLWVYGPGVSDGSTTPPAAVDALQAKSTAWGQSLLAFVIAPMLDLILGQPALVAGGPALIDSLWSRFGSAIALDALADGAVQPALTDSFGSAVKEALAQYPPLILSTLPSIAPAYVAAPAYLQTELTSLVGALTSAHLLQIANAWGSLPVVASYDLTVSSVGIGIQ